MPGKARRVHPLVRWFKSRIASKALVLMYHRIAHLSNDPQLLAVNPAHFAEHLQLIKTICRPLSLQALVNSIREGRVPDRAVVLTFDDGYSDNLYHAKPLLQESGIQATVFITSGQVGGTREFWWDVLDRVFLQPGTLPKKLTLNVDGDGIDLDLGAGAVYAEADYRRDQGWNIELPQDPSPRHRLYRSLYHWLHALPDYHRKNVIDHLLAWAGLDPLARATHRTLTERELLELGAGESIEIGAHTVSHPALDTLVEDEQREEIQASKHDLEAILDHPVVSFGYPHGSYSRVTIDLLRESGFVCACCSQPDAVFRRADPFQLPRVVVRDWDRHKFARWLKWWIRGY